MSESCEEKSFLRLIYLTGQAMRSFADQRLKRFDLTVEQLQVLKEVSVETGKIQNKLSEVTGKSPANITRILDRLEKKARIVRKNNPVDRRSSLVFLTKDGKRLRDDVEILFSELDADLLEGVAVDGQDVAFGVINNIKNNIDKMSGK